MKCRGNRTKYTYDPTGNRLLKIHDGARTTSAYDAANQLTYSQDASGRTTYTFDPDGNQQVVRAPNGDRTTYVWDYENRMTSVRLPSGIRNTMAYEPEGLRVKLEESTGVKKFVWDEQNYLAETDGSNDTQVVYTNEPRLYGNLVSQRRENDSNWFAFDGLGSTRETVSSIAVPSPGGQVLAEYEDGTLAREYTNGEYVDEPLVMIDRTASGAVGAVARTKLCTTTATVSIVSPG